MKSIFHRFIETIADVIRLYIRTRYVRNPGSVAITTGLFILALLLSTNYAVKIGVYLTWLHVGATASTQSTSPVWEFAFFGLAMLLIVSGATWLFQCAHRQNKREAEENDRKVVLCVQFDAYNEVIPALLTAAVPTEIKGKRIPILIQKRDALVGGHGIQDVADEVMHIKKSLLQHAGGRDLNDITVCAGGIAPVPFLFMLGNVLEDDRPVNWAEWERNSGRWLWSKDGTSVPAWDIPTLDAIQTSEVVLRSGITYPIAAGDVSRAFPNHDVVVWEPTEKLFQIVLDEACCIVICNEFKKLLCQLNSKGVKRVHFLLACSTALTMRLGSVLDPRNMPDVIVYQYEKSSDLLYTWGLGTQSNEGRKRPIFNDRPKPASMDFK